MRKLILMAMIFGTVGCETKAQANDDDTGDMGTGDPPIGAEVYSDNCAGCHGIDVLALIGPELNGWKAQGRSGVNAIQERGTTPPHLYVGGEPGLGVRVEGRIVLALSGIHAGSREQSCCDGGGAKERAAI